MPFPEDRRQALGPLVDERIARHDARERPVADIESREVAHSEDGSGEAPERIVLRFVHPTRAGEDRETVLMAVGPDWYQGTLPGLAEGRWRILIEDGRASWRLKTMWSTDQKSLSIAARAES